MSVNNSTVGCLSTAQIDPKWLTRHKPIYHDPNGNCYSIEGDGTIDYFAHYGYNPQLATGIVFLVLFGLLFVVHLGFAIKDRRWWLLTIAFGAALEVGGWVGRALSGVTNDGSNTSGNYYLVQICLLTIAPVFFSGACYGLLVTLINNLDASLSRITPRRLTYIFVACDVISLLLQAAGGALVSGNDTTAEQETYTHIFVAGIAFQLGVMIIFCAVGLDYYLRLRRVRLDQSVPILPGRLPYLVYGVIGASVTIIIRGGYRTAELSEGWHGYLINHEAYFLGFDGTMMLICLVILAATHTLFTCPNVPDAISSDAEKGTPLPSTTSSYEPTQTTMLLRKMRVKMHL